MPKVNQVITGKNQITKLIDTVRSELIVVRTGRPLLTMCSKEAKVTKVARAHKVRLVRNINQHVATYSFEDGGRTIEFKATRL